MNATEIISVFPYIKPMTEIRVLLNKLKPLKLYVGHLEVKGSTDKRSVTIHHLSKKTDDLLKLVSKYGHWNESRFTLADDADQAMDLMKQVTEYASIAVPEASDNPRDFFNVDSLDDVLKKVFSLFVTLDVSNEKVDHFIEMFRMESRYIFHSTITILKALADTFNCEYDLHNFNCFELSRQDTDGLEFVRHDNVIHYTEEEKEEIRKAELQKEEEERRKQQLANRFNEVKAFSEIISKCYDRHMSVGNLTHVRLSDSSIKLLSDPSSIDDCSKIESLFRLLIEMSNSVRYMPGEVASNEDRIMGSFMELDKDILSYKQPFTVYLSPALTHNDLVRSLPLFSVATGGKVCAQYTATKKYIEKLETNDIKAGIVHLTYGS